MFRRLRSKRAISPILATLLLIVIVVASAIAVYAWIQSYAGSQTSTASSFFVIENVHWDSAGNIDITVRNTGSASIVIDTVYVDGVGHSVENIVDVGDSETITVEYDWNSDQKYALKVVEKSGLMAERVYKAPSSTWLMGWAKRVKLTIDSNDVDGELTDFPVLVHLCASSGINGGDVSFVFDEAGSNSKKIAIATADGTECYVEVEEWDSGNEQAWLWVKVPSISSTADTELYLYYDADHGDNVAYVGDTASTPAENVWDSNFKLVAHMDDNPDTSSIRDSTSNGNDGTKVSADNPIQTDGVSGKAQDFSDDTINCGADGSLNIVDTLTIEAWINPDSLPFVNFMMMRGQSYWVLILNSELTFYMIKEGGGYGMLSAPGAIPTGTFSHVAVVYNVSDTDEVKMYINGQLSMEGSIDGPIASVTDDLIIGDYLTYPFPFDGTIDEATISDTARSGAWIKASYESGADNLLTFGNEETA